MRVTLNNTMRFFAQLLLGSLLTGAVPIAVAEEDAIVPASARLADLGILAKQLFSDIEHLSRYWASKQLPAISFVTQDEINRVICKKPCAVRAAYLPERGVLLLDSLDPINVPLDRSILVHELVHYLQEINNRYSELTPCKRWFQREHEAYAVQNMYLYRINANRHVGGVLEPSMCKDNPEEKKSTTFQTDADLSDQRY